jgi:meiotic recombination protein DMC1
MHGGNGKVAYIDTEGTLYPLNFLSNTLADLLSEFTYIPVFLQTVSLNGVFSRPERIVPIAERFGMDANAVLDNVWLVLSLLIHLRE